MQLLAIGVPPNLARRDAMQTLTITATTPYANRLSLQANLKYTIMTTNRVSSTIVLLSDINAMKCRSRILSTIPNPAHWAVI